MIDLVRERLLEMRHQAAVRILRQHPSSTTTAIDAMLAMLDEIRTGAVPATRAVVDDDEEIRLTFYAEEGAVASTALDPIRAVALAGELIQAALPRLSGRHITDPNT